MDNLVTKIRSRFDHEAAKKVLREKYQGKMLFAHAEGMWRAGPELHMTLLACPDTTAVILDVFDNPIRIDRDQLMKLNQTRWQEQMNAWLVEWEDLRKQR